MTDEGKADPETCPLCSASGPPTRTPAQESTNGAPALGSSEDDLDSEIIWIACSKCAKWYHSVCVMRNGETWSDTIPKVVLEEGSKASSAEWFDWPARLEKWYCRTCIDYSVNPSNPRPPRYSLVATLKPLPKQRAPRGKRSSTPTTHTNSSSKKARRSSSRPNSVAPDDGKQEEGSSTASTSGRPKRKAAENAPDYYAWNHGIAAPTTKWLQLISDPEKFGKDIQDADYPHLPANLLSKAWLDSEGTDEFPSALFHGADRRPLVIGKEDGGFEGLGGMLPSRDLKVTDVAEQVGMSMMVNVIDVATQTSVQWTLGKWAEYFVKASDQSYTGKVYNVISLEITGTPLAKRVRPPRLVKEIDWVDNCWHFGPNGKGNIANDEAVTKPEIEDNAHGNGEAKGNAPTQWPKVQLYCLMGIRGSWTDWHVDFAASSVYYTIHTGAKEFYFIEPTERNLKAYAEWSGSADLQQNTWLGDICEGGVKRVRLEAGDTMIIPAGYIHAVYTPKNAIVFGGNFVHSYSIATQLRLRQIEIDTKVPQRFRFPLFDKLCWYVADRYCAELRHLRAYRPRPPAKPPKPPAEVVLRGLQDLAKFLQSQVHILEDESAEEKRRKLVYDRVPGEVVRDPAGLARELMWRASRELHEEAHELGAGKVELNGARGGKLQWKEKTVDMKMLPAVSKVTGFKPTPWDQVNHPTERTESTCERPRPGSSRTEGEMHVSAKADLVTEVYNQKRVRLRHLSDGTTIEEEQEIVFTERRTTWAPAGARAETEPAKEAAGEVSHVEPTKMEVDVE